MNDTDVQAKNTDYKSKLHKNYKLVLQIWLVNNNVVPGSTKMLTQEHAALGKIRFCATYSASGLYIFFIMYVPWESNPQPFALQMQCSTTEPQED